MVEQKRGSVLLMDETFIHRGAGGPGRTIFFPFVPERFRTTPNVVEPDNVPDQMFVETEEPEEAEAEEDPRQPLRAVICSPLHHVPQS